MWLVLLLGAARANPLAEAIEAAHRLAPEAVRAGADRDLARAEAMSAWQAALPRLSGQVGYARNQYESTFDVPSGEVVISPQNQWDADVTLSLPVFAPSSWAAVQAASRRDDAAEAARDAAVHDLDLSVVSAYLSVALASTERKNAEENLAAARARLDVVEGRLSAGTVGMAEHFDATARVADAEGRLTASRLSGRAATDRLGRLTGLDIQAAELAEDLVPEPPREWSAGSDRVRRAEAQLEAARLELTAARWKYAPTLSASATERWTNATGFSGQALSWQVGATATVTLFDGLGRESAVAAAAARVRQAEAELTLAREEHDYDVASAADRLESAAASLVAADANRRARLEHARLLEAEFSVGRALASDAAASAQEAAAADYAWQVALASLLTVRAEMRRLAGLPVVEGS